MVHARLLAPRLQTSILRDQRLNARKFLRMSVRNGLSEETIFNVTDEQRSGIRIHDTFVLLTRRREARRCMLDANYWGGGLEHVLIINIFPSF